MTGVADHKEVSVTGLAGHPMLSREPVTDCSDRSKSFLQGADQSAGESIGSEESLFDKSGLAMCTPTSPERNASIRLCHFYIDIPDVDDNTY